VPNVTKQDLIQDVAQSTGFVRADIRTVLENFLSMVGETLRHGNTIEIRGFGTFSVKGRKSRPARNPRTGEEVLLEDRSVPLFKFSADLKERINQPSYLPKLPEAVPHAPIGQEPR
jgi:nucleoid DNA-binding protein